MPSSYTNYNENYWLLVEDDEDDQSIFKIAYKTAGIENALVIMNNGEEALEYLKKTKEAPFVIISDINMPRMNGIELLKEMKHERMAQFKSIPYLIISSSTSELEIIAAYTCGAQGYFGKTMSMIDQVELLMDIKKYWGKCRHPAATD